MEETKSETIDLAAERTRLIRIWQDTLSLCESIVKDAKEGKTVIRASMLQQINAHLKLSAEILQTLKVEEEQQEIKRQYGGTDEEDAEGDDVIPFPVTEEPLKIS